MRVKINLNHVSPGFEYDAHVRTRHAKFALMTPGTVKPHPVPARPHSRFTLILLGVIALVVFATTCALGTWQLYRLAWKEALIANIDARIHQPPVPAPAPSEWPSLNNDNAEYRRVTVTGVYQPEQQTLVQAVTELGGGYWMMTPLRLDDGSTILINRGFVLPQWRRNPPPESLPTGPTQVSGLLRMGEPSTTFLRDNDPTADRWYTRDLPAIAQVRGLTRVAPFSIDADAASSGNNQDPARAPVGGLTVVKYSNSHLSYAITWFALAAMVLVGVGIVIREERRRRKQYRA